MFFQEISFSTIDLEKQLRKYGYELPRKVAFMESAFYDWLFTQGLFVTYIATGSKCCIGIWESQRKIHQSFSLLYLLADN